MQKMNEKGSPEIKLSLRQVVGKGYGRFWNFKGRYRVVKGSRASKKSKTMALWTIVNMMKYSGANTLVVRKTYATLKDSCFTELKWAIRRLGVSQYWRALTSPLEMIYLPTGQKIYFRGLDDPLKLTSITVDKGSLCWVWIEEAYELDRESDFNMIDESVRGEVGPGLFKQLTLTLNPWNEKHWIKKRFFDQKNGGVLAMTTNYQCNEWLDESDKQVFETMKQNNPRRYQVAGLGNWGIAEGLVYENWEVTEFDWRRKYAENVNGYDVYTALFGIDFGFSIDPTAFIGCLASVQRKEIWIFCEFYEKRLSNRDIYDRIRKLGFHKQLIKADSEDPRTINELQLLGLNRIVPAKKGPDSIRAGIQKLQDYKLYVHPSCVHTETELSNYCWAADKTGGRLNRPSQDGFDHLLDALRYATEDLGSQRFSF